MEYLLVKFYESRGVIIDGVSGGRTNLVLELETGTHSVTLETPMDFTPELHEFVLRKTSVISPRVISFEKV